MLGRAVYLGLLLIGSVALHPRIADALSSRNPFRVADVANPDGPDVMQPRELPGV